MPLINPLDGKVYDSREEALANRPSNYTAGSVYKRYIEVFALSGGGGTAFEHRLATRNALAVDTIIPASKAGGVKDITVPIKPIYGSIGNQSIEKYYWSAGGNKESFFNGSMQMALGLFGGAIAGFALAPVSATADIAQAPVDATASLTGTTGITGQLAQGGLTVVKTAGSVLGSGGSVFGAIKAVESTITGQTKTTSSPQPVSTGAAGNGGLLALLMAGVGMLILIL